MFDPSIIIYLEKLSIQFALLKTFIFDTDCCQAKFYDIDRVLGKSFPAGLLLQDGRHERKIWPPFSFSTPFE